MCAALRIVTGPQYVWIVFVYYVLCRYIACLGLAFNKRR